MSFRHLQCARRAAAVLLLACFGAAVPGAEERVPGATRAIEFAPSTSGEVLTNINPFTSQTDSRLFLDAPGIENSLRPNQSGGSLGPVSPRSVFTPSRRSREEADLQKNWAFVTAEDAMQTYTLERILQVPEYGADGQPKAAQSAVERFYEQLQSQTVINRTHSDELFQRGLAGRPEDAFSRADPSVGAFSQLFGVPKTSATAELDLFPANQDPTDTLNALNLATLLNGGTSPEERRAQQMQEERLREFRRLINEPPASAGVNALPAPGSQNIWDNPAASGVLSSPFQSPNSVSPVGAVPGIARSSLPELPQMPLSLMSPNSPSAFNGQSFSAALPAPTENRFVPPPPMNFTAPQRKF